MVEGVVDGEDVLVDDDLLVQHQFAAMEIVREAVFQRLSMLLQVSVLVVLIAGHLQVAVEDYVEFAAVDPVHQNVVLE